MNHKTPPPPPPPPSIKPATPPLPPPVPPPLPLSPPPDALLLELLTYNGHPYKDHWAYYLNSPTASPNTGTLINAVGDLIHGFTLIIERSHRLGISGPALTHRVKLQWVAREWVDEKAVFNAGVYGCDSKPVCALEESLWKVEAPTRSLSAVGHLVTMPPKRIVQRNCQTWIVESADQLVKDGIFDKAVAEYLHAIEQ